MYLAVEKKKNPRQSTLENAAQEYCVDHVTLAVLTKKNEKIKGGVCQSAEDGSEKRKNKIEGRK
jgi:hypothetical protein